MTVSRISDKHGGHTNARRLPKHERTAFLAWQVAGIIENGGFQYLFEAGFPPGDPGFIYSAAAFRAIGSDVAAEAFEEALKLFPGDSPPADRAIRLSRYEAVNESKREGIDKKFWSALDDITTKLAKYIRGNQSLFDR